MSDQVKYTQRLRGQKVLVIGGSSGMGYGVAEASLEEGASVFISSSNQSKLDAKVAQLKSTYPSAEKRVAGYVCDLSNVETLETNIKKLLDSVGKIDHIAFTAGDALALGPITGVSVPMIIKASAVRFYAPLIIGKYAANYLTGGPRSSITFTVGTAAEHPLPNWTIMSSILSGLGGTVRGLALDLKPIRVNSVSPGLVDTELWLGLMPEENKKGYFKQSEEKLATGKVGTVENLAQSYIYLMKDHNVTGIMLSTNGGNSIVS